MTEEFTVLSQSRNVNSIYEDGLDSHDTWDYETLCIHARYLEETVDTLKQELAEVLLDRSRIITQNEVYRYENTQTNLLREEISRLREELREVAKDQLPGNK